MILPMMRALCKVVCFPFSFVHDALYNDSFVPLPTLSIVLNIVLACLLSLLKAGDSHLSSAEAESLRSRGLRMISLVSTASITIVTLTFSLTVLSVQIAAGNYSPRMLEDFLKDPNSKIVISVNLGAYAYCYGLTYFIDDTDAAAAATQEDGGLENLPYVGIHVLSVHMAVILLFFVHYIHFFLNAMRLDDILLKAAAASLRAAKTLASESDKSSLRLRSSSSQHGRRRRARAVVKDAQSGQSHDGYSSDVDALPSVPHHAYKVLADTSGYVTKFTLDHIVDKAYDLDVRVRYRHYIGDFVNEGTILCLVWDAQTRRTDEESFVKRVDRIVRCGDDRCSRELTDRFVEKKLGLFANKGIRIEDRRDSDYDVTLGIQQIVDTAVRALSAAVNDPQTAIQCLDVLSPLIIQLAQMDLGVPHALDEDDFIRVCAPRRSFSFLLCMLDPIRRYGGADLTVCRRALRFFGEVAAVLARSDRLDRIPSAVAQMDEWMRVARDNFFKDSAEIISLMELYCHTLEVIAESDAMVIGDGRFSPLRDTEDFEKMPIDSEAPIREENALLVKAELARTFIQKAVSASSERG